jgi:MSHA biogenesis protein MshJ
MKEQWRKLAARIDALSLRERVMVFVSAVVVAVFTMNALFIDSPTTRNKALSARMAQQQAELQALQGQIQALMQKRTDPNAANLARRDGIKRQIAAIDATLQDMQHSLIPAQNMKAVLQEVLVHNPRLQLIALRTLPATPLVEVQDKAGKTDAAASALRSQDKTAAGASSIFKHGVRITLQGSYTDLHDYLARLEKLPWRMFWSRASLNADDYPHLMLTVTIYTLSLDKAWLEV